MLWHFRFFYSVALFLFALSADGQFYTGSQLDFGKNRVQYNPVVWEFYRYKGFDVFFYTGGKELSHLTAEAAQRMITDFEARFNYSLENRPQIILFTRLSDLKQTNLGTAPELANNPGGLSRTAGNKILLNLESGTVAFLSQLRMGLCAAFVQELLYGGNLRERVRSKALLTLPAWFEKGLIRFLCEPWTSDEISRVRDGFIHNRYLHLGRLDGEEALLAGKSFWSFISVVYGEKVIPDILEATRAHRNADGGLQAALSMGTRGLIQEWLNYLDKNYFKPEKELQAEQRKAIQGKARRNYTYPQVAMSRDGQKMAWVRNEFGKVRIYLSDSSGKNRSRIYSAGFKLRGLNDYTWPVLAWHPQHLLVFTDEHKGRLRIHFYNPETQSRETKFLNDMSKVNSIDVSPDGKTLLVCGIRNGQSDLFLYNNIANTWQPLSQDRWDEAHARWLPDGENIVFSSNRTSDSLFPKLKTRVPLFPEANHDLFQLNVYDKSTVLRRLTQTPEIHESSAEVLGNGSLRFLSNANGVTNLYAGFFDSTIAYIDTSIHYRYFLRSEPLTNTARSIEQHSCASNGSALELVFNRGCWNLYKRSAETVTPSGVNRPNLPSLLSPARQEPQAKAAKDSVPETLLLIRRYVFAEKEQQQQGRSQTVNTPEAADTFRLTKQRMYETAWYTEGLSTRIDRSFLNQTYQPYAEGGYFNPALNGLFRISLADLFEDYRIVGGFRLASNLTGNEYLISVQHLRNRNDHLLTFHRQGIQTASTTGSRTLLHSLQYGWTRPVSPLFRLHISGMLRHDQTVFLSTDLANLSREPEANFWTQAKAEIVFDSHFSEGPNLMSGERVKATVEHFRDPANGQRSTTVMGFDARMYRLLTRELMLGLRLAGASSVGPGKVLFYLGGVDGWLIPRFDNSVSPSTQNYLFQTLATPVRGFIQNIRNGNSFAVSNVELRWNLVRFFARYPLRNEFLNSLQLLGFADGGTAFTGPSPYSEENTFNQKIIESGPIKVTLKNQEEPIVFGFGTGLRMKLFGYFVRADYAWGILDGRRMPGVFYLSLANDF